MMSEPALCQVLSPLGIRQFPQPPCEVGTVVFSILQMRTLSPGRLDNCQGCYSWEGMEAGPDLGWFQGPGSY